MAHTSEYEVEDIFIDRLEGIGYGFIKLGNYDDVLAHKPSMIGSTPFTPQNRPNTLIFNTALKICV